MRILCAIGQRGGPELIRRVAALAGVQAGCLLLHVIDVRPRHELEEYLRGPVHRRPPEPARAESITASEESAAQAIVQEALAAAQEAGLTAASLISRGQPEQIIVQAAGEKAVDLIVIRAREGAVGHPRLGPASVGHIARFVLDHAPCDVLLLREES